MKARQINEDINDILRSKSKEEINNIVKKYLHFYILIRYDDPDDEGPDWVEGDDNNFNKILAMYKESCEDYQYGIEDNDAGVAIFGITNISEINLIMENGSCNIGYIKIIQQYILDKAFDFKKDFNLIKTRLN